MSPGKLVDKKTALKQLYLYVIQPDHVDTSSKHVNSSPEHNPSLQKGKSLFSCVVKTNKLVKWFKTWDLQTLIAIQRTAVSLQEGAFHIFFTVSFGFTLLFFSLEMLDKVDPPAVPDGYGLSVGFYCLVEAVRTIQLLVEGEKGGEKGKEQIKKEKKDEPAAGDTTKEKGI